MRDMAGQAVTAGDRPVLVHVDVLAGTRVHPRSTGVERVDGGGIRIAVGEVARVARGAPGGDLSAEGGRSPVWRTVGRGARGRRGEDRRIARRVVDLGVPRAVAC